MVSSHTYIFEAINFDHHPAFLNWICFRHPGHPAVGIITKIFTLQRGGGLLCNTYHGKANMPDGKWILQHFRIEVALLKLEYLRTKDDVSEFIYVLFEISRVPWHGLLFKDRQCLIQTLETRPFFCSERCFQISLFRRGTTGEEEQFMSHYLTSSSYLVNLSVCHVAMGPIAKLSGSSPVR